MATTAHGPAALIERYIEPNPHKPGEAEARLRDHGVSVWALVEYWYGVDFDKATVARDYELPAEAVDAALAYYKAHKGIIDARIAVNAA
ncbi:MAG TPA: DUF433 domain-containing protein [Chloroflexota bacterium]|nr:DUF433 domain-containing protein [Chloroflexota bacterium]